ncbi:MAG: OmpA family protein, partial [Bacteroidales bacterium]
LYFDMNSSELSVESKKKINHLLATKEIKALSIIAYTDFVGSEKANFTLSRNRCQSTQEYLLSQSFPNEKIVYTKGLGVHENSNIEHVTDPSDRGIREHRLVEIIYLYDGIKKKKVPASLPKKPVKSKKMLSQPIPDFSKLKVGEKALLEHINFVGGTARFLPEAIPTLKKLLDFMQQNSTVHIQLEGHICCQLNGLDGFDMDARNDSLSLNRARAVFNYLTKNGIDPDRIFYIGRGSSQKIYQIEATEAERTVNRRVEISILKK